MALGVALRDVLRLPVLQHARVVGGAAGLDRPVRHVNVMEVPDILGWVHREELLLTTAYPLREDPAALAQLVPALAERGLAGLAIKPARYIPAIPPDALLAADALAFPVIELPATASFNDIINGVLTIILNQQAARLQRSAEIHDRFTGIALSGGGLREIAEALGELIGREIGIADVGGAIRAGLGIDGNVERVQVIQAGGEQFGSIVVGGGERELDDEAADALEYAATVAALRLMQARVVAEADRRYQAICLEELISGPVDRGILLERATAFKWDLSVPRAVLLARIDSVAGRPFAQLVGQAEEVAVRHRLADSVRAAAGRSAIVWERTAEVAALIAAGARTPAGGGRPLLPAEQLERIAGEVRRALPEAVVSMAIGRAVEHPAQYQASFSEAGRALEVGRWSDGPGAVTAFDGLGLDRLLARVEPAELREFAAATLGPLEAHDRRHGTELCRTLDVYLATRNGALAARQLFIHYNTLKGRLALIRELVGPLVDDPERSLAASVALRLRRLPLPD
jgi:purine catabolism regulator